MQAIKDDEYFVRMGKRPGESKREDMSNAQIRKELFRLCEQFIIENEISYPEAIYQRDSVIGNAYEFLEEMCNIVGYASIEQIEELEDEDAGC